MKIKQLISNFKTINIYELFDIVFSYDTVQNWIIGTIQNRINDYGVTASLTKMQTNRSFTRKKKGAVYAYRTERIKKKKSDKWETVTLKDTGAFYDSWNIKRYKKSFSITADDIKEEGEIFDNFSKLFRSKQNYIKEVFGLSTNETNILLTKIILPDILNLIRKKIQKNG